MVLVKNCGEKLFELDWECWHYAISPGQTLDVPSTVAKAITKRCCDCKVVAPEDEKGPLVDELISESLEEPSVDEPPAVLSKSAQYESRKLAIGALNRKQMRDLRRNQ